MQRRVPQIISELRVKVVHHPILYGLILLGLAVGGVLLVRQPVAEATDPSVRMANGLLLVKDHLFTGILIERNLNHDLLDKNQYKAGEQEGFSFKYHHNGAIVGRAMFHHGKKDGRQEAFYVDGKLRSVGFFKDGVAVDTFTEWHPNGTVYRQQKIENGVEVENKMFYESGVIYSNYVVQSKRTYGIQGEPLCNAVKQEGFK
jgi:hypothetical protein